MIDFYPYDEVFPKLFQEEKERIKSVLPEAGVRHIGSTAVPGLGGKGIIDILVTISDWEDKHQAVKSLRQIGFSHVHPEENGRIFLSRRPQTDYKDTHIHLVQEGNEEYEEKIAFRDYLRENPEQARRYAEIKKKAAEEAGGDRDKYADLKNDFIEKVSAQLPG